MATLTRVSTYQCHKLSLVNHRLPELSSTLVTTATSSSYVSFPNKNKKFSRFSVLAMADLSINTVLVTGAGGRTGKVSMFSFLGFLDFILFLDCISTCYYSWCQLFILLTPFQNTMKFDQHFKRDEKSYNL